MKLKSVIFGIIMIEVATKQFVKGLQCYVCEDCNEYEDFKELHICGETPDEITIKPFTLPEILGGSTTRPPFGRTTVAPSTNPNEKTTIDDYLYEDSEEKHDAQNSSQKKVTRKNATISTLTSTIAGTTSTLTSPNAGFATSTRQLLPTTPSPSSTTLEEKSTKITIQSLVTNSMATVANKTIAESKSSTSTVAVTTVKALPDYDDYVEYEDTFKMSRSEVEPLLKISEPICYLLRYRDVNNSIITNRGCTTFINANKYLTCQSLYNGNPMEYCRVCSANGCNKFLDDDDSEDNDGILFNAAAALQQFGILILLLWVIASQTVI